MSRRRGTHKRDAEQDKAWQRIHHSEDRLKEVLGPEAYFRDCCFKVAKLPKPDCHACHGRGYTGWDVGRGRISLCGCTGRWEIKAREKLEPGDIAIGFAGTLSVIEEPAKPTIELKAEAEPCASSTPSS